MYSRERKSTLNPNNWFDLRRLIGSFFPAKGNGIGANPVEQGGSAAGEILKSNLIDPNASSFDNNSPASKGVLRK